MTERKKAHGLAQRDLDLPSQPERQRIAAHAEALRVNKAREEGHSADFWTPGEATSAAYLDVTETRRHLYARAQKTDRLEYRSQKLFVKDSRGRYIGVIAPENVRGSRHQWIVGAWTFDPCAKPYRVTIFDDDGPGPMERLAKAVSEEVSFHTGPHGIQWAERVRRDEVDRVIKAALIDSAMVAV